MPPIDLFEFALREAYPQSYAILVEMVNDGRSVDEIELRFAVAGWGDVFLRACRYEAAKLIQARAEQAAQTDEAEHDATTNDA
jgi:hypothetical protein